MHTHKQWHYYPMSYVAYVCVCVCVCVLPTTRIQGTAYGPRIPLISQAVICCNKSFPRWRGAPVHKLKAKFESSHHNLVLSAESKRGVNCANPGSGGVKLHRTTKSSGQHPGLAVSVIRLRQFPHFAFVERRSLQVESKF